MALRLNAELLLLIPRTTYRVVVLRNFANAEMVRCTHTTSSNLPGLLLYVVSPFCRHPLLHRPTENTPPLLLLLLLLPPDVRRGTAAGGLDSFWLVPKVRLSSPGFAIMYLNSCKSAASFLVALLSAGAGLGVAFATLSVTRDAAFELALSYS